MRAAPPEGVYHTDEAHRAAYSRAACIYRRRPRGVLFPKGEGDLRWGLRFARSEGLSLTLRGGGSGLAGQTVGEGIVADVSRWMGRIVQVDPAGRQAVVEPGVVLSDLNRAAATHGLWFSADPSSQDFCTVGGMLANNSKGARAVKHGTTLDRVRWLRILLADGAEVLLERRFQGPDSFPHPGLRQAARLILERKAAILRRWPRSRTNTSGYNLMRCVAGAPDGAVDLVPLFVGSEGTLGVFVEAGLELSPIPRYRSLSMIEFGSVEEAGASVLALLPEGPSACEILDRTFLEIIRRGLGAFPLPVEDRTETLLLVEADGESRDEAEETMDRLLRAASAGGPLRSRRAESGTEREAIWSFRKAASPLLNKGRGALKSTRFIEDGAVPAEAIPEFLRRVEGLCTSRGIQPVIFGHAGDGNLHVNPFMDLTDPAHFRLIPEIALENARLLAELGGSLSGEHGDGRLRTPYLPVIYGDLAGLFREIKNALDPEDLLNRGILAPAAPEPVDAGLRFHPAYRRRPLPSRLSDPSWAIEAERCHGCGTCRDFCPTAEATDHDLLSSRGRGHLLQALLAGDLEVEEAGRRGVRDIFRSCLGCSRCAQNCPTGVDIAPLAALFREAFTPGWERARDALLAAIPSMGYKTGPLAGRILRASSETVAGRWAGRCLLGLRRDLEAPALAPSFAFDPRNLYSFPGGGREKAAYYYGCFGNTYDPAGEASLAVAVLRALGADVVVPPQACCGASAMTRGLLDQAAEDSRRNRRSFLPWLDRGYTLVASSPSCLLALTRGQERFFPGGGAEQMVSRSSGIFSFIRRLLDAPAAPALGRADLRCVYLKPCHGAILGTQVDEIDVLGRIPGIEILDVTEECCGMAGAFGAEAANSELSDAIGEVLLARIRRSAPEAVVTPCGSCRTRVISSLGIPVHHPLSLLARSLGIGSPDPGSGAAFADCAGEPARLAGPGKRD